MKKLKLLLVILLSVFMFMPVVNATTIEDLAKADENVTVEEELDGTSFVMGNHVNLKNKVNGISFVMGNNVNVKSTTDYAFIMGNFIDLTGISTKDLFVMGNQITIDTNSIERDIYAVGSDITIRGNVGRNVYVSGANITIDANIEGEVVVDAETINIVGDSSIKSLKYNDNTKIDISDDATISKKDTYKVSKEVKKSTTDVISEKIMSTFKAFIRLLVIAFIMMYLFKSLFKNIQKEELKASTIILDILLGLGLLLLVPFAALVLLISNVGVSLGLISALIYGIFIYVSGIITAYYFGKKVLDKKIKNDYLLVAVSLLVLVVVKQIPVLGGLVAALSLFFGLGLLVKKTKETLK